eukprot:TRINITY_DN26400_c0_g1_i3.p1 TRINITY_DN26400_c0_g1~~TRINITY_DN26400_c0_g1_i3.p1  ORF type:complete len:225 (+),score=20.68 TRINITY_DN26400_c0_g1_i3:277-951(+)
MQKLRSFFKEFMEEKEGIFSPDKNRIIIKENIEVFPLLTVAASSTLSTCISYLLKCAPSYQPTNINSIPYFLILSLPSPDYLPNLFKYEHFLQQKFQNCLNTTCYHSADFSVLTNPDYLNFISKFGKSSTHVLDCQDLSEDQDVFQLSTEITNEMHNINNDLFPELNLLNSSHLIQKNKGVISKLFMDHSMNYKIVNEGEMLPLYKNDINVLALQRNKGPCTLR